MGIVSFSGRLQSGKDTAAKIFQFLTYTEPYTDRQIIEKLKEDAHPHPTLTKWKNKKFADKLKDTVCLLIGCDRIQLEDQTFKNTVLGPEWWVYKQKDGTLFSYLNHKYSPPLDSTLVKTTPRLLLQLIGTEGGRNLIHPDIWVNALMAEYKPMLHMKKAYYKASGLSVTSALPDWLITDVRFHNEVEAIKSRDGIVIRVNRQMKISQYDWDSKCPLCKKSSFVSTPVEGTDFWVHKYSCIKCTSEFTVNFGDKMGGGFDLITVLKDNYTKHESEIALDDYQGWDYVIDNNEGLQELIYKVREIMLQENLL